MTTLNQPIAIDGNVSVAAATAADTLTPALALARVRGVVPAGQSIAIHCDLWNHPSGLRAGGEPPAEVSFRVWDGFQMFEGATLEAAVEACVLAYQPKPRRPLEMAGAFFAGVKGAARACNAALNQEAA